MTRLGQSPSATVGPFFGVGLIREGMNVIVTDETRGERIRIEGRLLDGHDQPVPDGMIEIWQANAQGRYNHALDHRNLPLDPGFRGWGRAATNATGTYWFETIKPGRVPGLAGVLQAPHVNVIVFARGMPLHAFTRIYFDGEEGNASDPVLGRIAEPARRETLIARRDPASGRTTYRFDIRLQGSEETVFFDA